MNIVILLDVVNAEASTGNNKSVMFYVALVIVAIFIVGQFLSFIKTWKTISLFANFFPESDVLTRIDTSISKDVLDSSVKLNGFIKNPPAKVEQTDIVDGDSAFGEDSVEYIDISLIKTKKNSGIFEEVIEETNAYLCKNIGTSADFSVLQDICERKLESLDSQISNTINVPLYLGLACTFIGIITGLAGIASDVKSLFDTNGEMASLSDLLGGVVIAMFASLLGLSLMIINSAIRYKKAIATCEKNKNSYYDFLRRELMPTLSSSMASSLNSLRGVLGEFIGNFGHNLDAYNDSAALLNDNIKEQHLLLVEVNKMKHKEVSMEIAEAFDKIRQSTDSLNLFSTYQKGLNDTILTVNGAVEKIETILKSFEDFASSLNIVVENQNSTTELQKQFKAAIEKNFPMDSDIREIYRKQFDELTSDALMVTDELGKQLKSSTEYISAFVNNNKSAFTSLSKMDEVLTSLVEYANIQAGCYKDLKQEISSLRIEQVKTQQNAAKLNADLLFAVKEMVSAIKMIKN